MKRVTGLGGLFFKAENPEEMYKWYEKHLGLERQNQEAVAFNWRYADEPQKSGMTVWAIFKRDTEYFNSSRSSFMRGAFHSRKGLDPLPRSKVPRALVPVADDHYSS